jgi:hypothetical protein
VVHIAMYWLASKQGKGLVKPTKSSKNQYRDLAIIIYGTIVGEIKGVKFDCIFMGPKCAINKGQGI